MSTQILFVLALVLPVGLVLMLIFREIVCWYWKINLAMRHLSNLDKTLMRCERMLREQGARKDEHQQ